MPKKRFLKGALEGLRRVSYLNDSGQNLTMRVSDIDKIKTNNVIASVFRARFSFVKTIYIKS